MAWRRRLDPDLLLIGALLAAAILLIALGWHLTFFQDTWAVLLERQPFDAHSLLTPHNEHLIVFQIAVQKLLVEVFGMTSAHPEMLFMTATLLAAGALLYVYVKRRVGAWLALFATVLLLFLGAAWQILLWPFEMEFSAPLAAGLGTLLVLEREDRRGDIFACLLLVVALGFGSLGLSFWLAALVAIGLAHRERGWGRLWIVAIPAVLYLGWYAGWGHKAEHHLTLVNVLGSPRYVFEGFASSIGALAGLSNQPITGAAGEPGWGQPLLVAAIGVAIWRLWRRPGLPRTFWPIAVAALSYWLLAAFNFIPGREAASVRYVYAGAAFTLLVGVELLSAQGLRLGRRAIWIGAVVTVLAVLPNLVQLKNGYEWLKEQTVLTRADMGAMEIASRILKPEFVLDNEVSGTASLINVNGTDYPEAVRKWGTPAYTPAEIAAAPEVGRHWADVVLSQALPLKTVTVLEGYEPSLVGGSRCTAIPPGGLVVPEVPIGPGTTRVVVGPGGEAALSMRRFAQAEYPVQLSGGPGGSVVELQVPKDRAPEYPWQLHVGAEQETWVCPG